MAHSWQRSALLKPGFPQEHIMELDEYNGTYNGNCDVRKAMADAFKPQVCLLQNILDWSGIAGGSECRTQKIRMPQQILLLCASPRIRDSCLAMLVCMPVRFDCSAAFGWGNVSAKGSQESSRSWQMEGEPWLNGLHGTTLALYHDVEHATHIA